LILPGAGELPARLPGAPFPYPRVGRIPTPRDGRGGERLAVEDPAKELASGPDGDGEAIERPSAAGAPAGVVKACTR
jgi:hypothetical protein